MFDDNLLTFAHSYNVIQLIAEGSFPARDPYLYLDLIRTGISSILYWPHQLYYVVGAVFFANNVEVLRILWVGLHFLHICLPSLSMYFLLRYCKLPRWPSVFGGIVYGWNLYMTIMAGIYTAHHRALHMMVIPLVWLIGMYSLDLKRYYLNIFSGLLIGWAILAGGLQPVIYIIPFLLLYLFFRLLFKTPLEISSKQRGIEKFLRPFKKENIFYAIWIPSLVIVSLIVCILPLLVTAPEILPYLSRAQADIENLRFWVKLKEFYPGIIEPFFQWSTNLKTPWETGRYFGFVSIPLFLIGLVAAFKNIFRKNSSPEKWFLIILVFSLTLCIGYVYFPRWVLKLLLFQKGFTRYPFRIYPLVMFTVSFFTATGLDYLQTIAFKRNKIGKLLLAACLIIGFFSFALKIYLHKPGLGGDTFFQLHGIIAFLLLVCFIFIFFKPRFSWLLIALIIWDLGLVGYIYCDNRFQAYKIGHIKKDLYHTSFLRTQDQNWISRLPKTDIPYRVFIFTTRESEITTQTGYIYNRLRHPFGYPGSIGIERLDKFSDIKNPNHPIFDILGVKFFYLDGYVLLNQDVLPLFYTTDRVKFFKTDAELLEEVSKGNNEMKNVVYFSLESLGNDADLFSSLGAEQHLEPVARLNPVSYTNSKVEFSVTSSRDTLAVLSEPWLPPWQAMIDGKKTKIYQAYGLIQAILIPKGSHFVRFEYICPIYLILISGIIQIAIFIFSVLYFYKKRLKKDDIDQPLL